MKLRIKNNRPAPYGVEKVGGGYEFIQAGKTRVVDAANPSPLYDKEFLDVEAEDSEVEAMPAKLKAKAEKPIVPSVDEVLGAEVADEAFTGFLDRSIPLIVEDLPKQGLADLRRILRDEKKGKSRKGLVAAIEEEIASRSK